MFSTVSSSAHLKIIVDINNHVFWHAIIDARFIKNEAQTLPTYALIKWYCLALNVIWLTTDDGLSDHNLNWLDNFAHLGSWKNRRLGNLVTAASTLALPDRLVS